ncbi:hypothetical protein F383_02344 [Gossypium arboreum]|uniref:Cleavage stimulation factor 50 kDa subunit n=1 Tax=Gossypium arboreum TaxID=29729 RepID=A0A0B0P100_GOSAR|nr:hypothetical protein F383_02344 [Gossypium arboreum]
MEGNNLEKILQEGNLFRQLNCLIVAHLRHHNLTQAARAVASATMTPLDVEAPPNKLLELVAKGLAVEKDETLRGVPSSTLFDLGTALGYGLNPDPRVSSVDFRQYPLAKFPCFFPCTVTPLLASARGAHKGWDGLPDEDWPGGRAYLRRRQMAGPGHQASIKGVRKGRYGDTALTITNPGLTDEHTLEDGGGTWNIDKDSAVQDTKGSSKSFPKHETRHLSEHKNIARCARFSPDGRFVATGSADTSIKLFEISKIKQMMLPDSKEGPVRPVIRTFYDHVQPINDLDFHPQSTVLISGAKDNTIKFFDFSKATAKRAFRVIQDTHNVRSVSFHPSGDFLLAGTDHPIAHLYDVNTFQCYLSANSPEIGVNGAINQVRYSSTGGMYVTASKDGAIRLWDGVSASCVRAIAGAHRTAEATSACFTKDQRFVLSCGKDSAVKLWEIGTGRLVKQYLGATHTQLRCQAVFNDTEEFVLSIDEPSNEIVIWDALTADKVAKWPSNHIGVPRWIEHSPTEAAFISCGTDRSVRFWKENL